MNLEKLFNPESVAVIGASPNKESVGYAILSNLKNGGKREIYPINPQYKKILGLKTYAGISEIKSTIDLALIAVRASIVPQILKECGEKKITFVVIIASGFKEAGAEGQKLENEIKSISQKYKINILGPNCLGIINSHSELNASFAPTSPLKGKIAFVSQSGALGSAILDWTKNQNIGFSKFISFGNEAGLTENDFLEYLAHDPETKFIAMYLESISNGEKFVEIAKKITPQKPIVVIKAGRSQKGLSAVMSHTGSLAPQNLIFEAACRKSGVITVESLRQFSNMLKLFHLGISKPITKLAILTNGGGPSVVATDLLDLSKSLELVELPQRTQEALKKVLPPMAALKNPVDILGDALSLRYADTLQILIQEKNIEALIIILTPQMMTEAEKTAEIISGFSKIKPVFPVFMGGESVKKGVKILEKNNLVNFDFPKDVVEALEALSEYSESKNGIQQTQLETNKNKQLDFDQTLKLLGDYKIAPLGKILKDKSELDEFFKNSKEPMAMKVVSDEIIHKTDVQGVVLNLKNAEEAKNAWEKIMDSIKSKMPQVKIQGVFLGPMAYGKELIIGMKRDPVFGSVIAFGMGGIFAETIKDTSLRLAPISDSESLEIIKSIKAYPVLSGVRGEKPINMAKIQQIIKALSQLAIEHPEIKEVDLNPVIVNENEANIVDARIIVAK